MRVLDIDLDFFLSDTCPFAPEGERPSEACAQPLSEAETRAYLENNLGLDTARPIPGRVFETHDGALLFWDELIKAGRLCPPFEVTHVDAHTDLGIAQRGYPYVKNSVLCRPPQNRRCFEEFRALKQLNEANFLAFALAARLVSRLENIRNPASKPDFPAEMLDGAGIIRLKSAFPALFEAKNGFEPPVPYIEYADPAEYRAEAPFDFMSLAISPRYSPASADRLVKVIGEYMTEE